MVICVLNFTSSSDKCRGSGLKIYKGYSRVAGIAQFNASNCVATCIRKITASTMMTQQTAATSLVILSVKLKQSVGESLLLTGEVSCSLREVIALRKK